MMRIKIGAVLGLAVIPLMTVNGRAATVDPSEYGSGLIEFLMVGRIKPTAPELPPSQQAGGAPEVGSMPQASKAEAPPSPAPESRVRLATLPSPVQVERSVPVPEAAARGQLVDYAGAQEPGTIVIDTRARYLYLVQASGRALRYAVAVGRPGKAWRGVETITAKREWPDWSPPPEMIRRRPGLARHVSGGPHNPLGARALYLGSSLYRIHGTTEPNSIGKAVSSGCIRMRNEDVIELYQRTPVGTRVEVL